MYINNRCWLYISGSYEFDHTTDIYNLESDSYTPGANVTEPIHYSYVVIDGTVTAIAQTADTVIEYDDVNDEWNSVPGILTGPSNGAAFDSSLVYVGDKYPHCFPP